MREIMIVISFWVSFGFSSAATTHETEIAEIKIENINDLYATNLYTHSTLQAEILFGENKSLHDRHKIRRS